jgi:hypothetical protein
LERVDENDERIITAVHADGSTLDQGKSSFLIAACLLIHLFDYFLCLNTLIIGLESSRA